VALCQTQPALTVEGVGGKNVVLSAADIAKLPQKTITATVHGSRVTFGGVLLADVLAKVDLPTGEKFQGTAASYFLTVEAKDRYKAVFAWAELDSTFMEQPVCLVMKRDGKPLSEKDGPFETVVPGEKKDARWVRQVISLKIERAD
jgi:hypothetical protein